MANDDDRITSPPRLSRHESTFTPNRLEAILREEQNSPGPFPIIDPHTLRYITDDPNLAILDTHTLKYVKDGPHLNKCQIDTDFFDSEPGNDGISFHDNERARLHAENFCKEMYGHDAPVSVSVTRLDALLSKIFKFGFQTSQSPEAVVTLACGLLERMPARPPELDDAPKDIPCDYRESCLVDATIDGDSLWEQLRVTTYVSSTILRSTLATVIAPSCVPSLRDVTNILACLLEIVSQLVPGIRDKDTLWRSFVVRAFLWTNWQRLQLIYFHVIASTNLTEGFSDGKKGNLMLRGTFPTPKIPIHELSRRQAGLNRSAYMCGWNFELLRTNPVCIAADFRYFDYLYNAAFGDLPARCLKGQTNSCPGDSPAHCERFQGMVIENQSQHDVGCSGDCKRLPWNEISYRSVIGARAVSLALTNNADCETLQYCSASDRTIAISHVWSHGQGGRPETGINKCLHLRYSDIAEALGCTSYWIDTACIPEDHKLRAESIAKINDVFLDAKVMLVCDRDIMTLDVSDMTLATCETILVTAIASDWNVRAWTFFEAFRGRRVIHLLCKDNGVVTFKYIIEAVQAFGALEIGILLLTAPHFLPPLDDRVLTRQPLPPNYEEGHLSIEIGSSLLNYRAASRPGDDIVIWSLLSSETNIFYDAESFWRSLQGEAFKRTGRFFHSDATGVATSFLISSMPRLKSKGLSWAPASPTLHLNTTTKGNGLNVYDGGRSSQGLVTANGLVADWLLFRFESDAVRLDGKHDSSELHMEDSEILYPINLKLVRSEFLQGYRWGVLLLPVPSETMGVWWENSAYLRRTIVAVCGTNDPNGTVTERFTWNSSTSTNPGWVEHRDVSGWEWKGIHLWDDVEPLPEFQMVHTFLIG